jgi:hypothetical protein
VIFNLVAGLTRPYILHHSVSVWSMYVGLSLDCFASGSESKKGRETILHKHFFCL